MSITSGTASCIFAASSYALTRARIAGSSGYCTPARPFRSRSRSSCFSRPSFVTVPAGVELQLRRVVVVGRPHRPHDRDVVNAPGQVRPPVADLDAGLAVLLEPDLRRVELV